MSSQLDRFPQVGHSVLGFPSRLLSRTWVGKNTVALQFQRPRSFLFRPGQFIDLILPGIPTGTSPGLIHTFSIASSCFASDILVVTRMRDSDFKRALSVLPLGTEVSIRGPMGSFVLHSDVSRPPFSACFRLPQSTKLTHLSFSFFYANRYVEDAAFMDTLWDLEMSNRNFHFVPTFTRIVQGLRGWKGATGPINEQMLSQHIGDLQDPIYYVAGSPGMVSAAHQTLTEFAVPEEDIRIEHFAGY